MANKVFNRPKVMDWDWRERVIRNKAVV